MYIAFIISENYSGSKALQLMLFLLIDAHGVVFLGSFEAFLLEIDGSTICY